MVVVPPAKLQLADALTRDNQRAAKFAVRTEQDIHVGDKREVPRSREKSHASSDLRAAGTSFKRGMGEVYRAWDILGPSASIYLKRRAVWTYPSRP